MARLLIQKVRVPKGQKNNREFSRVKTLNKLELVISSVVDPELLSGSVSGSGIIVPDPDPAKHERADK